MRYTNLTKSKLSDNRFSSRDFTFRPTTMSDALYRAGISDRQSLVREAVVETDRGVFHSTTPRNAMGQAVV